MRPRRLSALAMFMVLLVTCLISVPVFPGENPWDADVSGGRGDGPIIVVTDPGDRDTLVIIPEDTVTVADGTSMSSTQSSPLPAWLENLMTQVALWFAITGQNLESR